MGAAAWAAVRGSVRAAVASAAWSVVVAAALVASALATGRAGWGALGMGLSALAAVVAAATLQHGRLPTEVFFGGPFAFRVAEHRSAGRQLARSLAQLVVFWVVLLGVLPWLAAWVEVHLGLAWPWLRGAAPVRVAGLVLVAAASAIALWACVAMAVAGDGTPLPSASARRLVVAGPYRSIRNPMAAMGFLQAVGVGLALGSWIVLGAALVGAVGWHVVIRPGEEADLAARFGPPYDAYCAAVRCWVPRWPVPRDRPVA